MDYDEALGTLELGDPYLGAYGPARRGPQFAGRGGPPRGYRPAPMIARGRLVPNIPGVPNNDALRLKPLGLGSTTFTATSGTILQLTASPQKPFKPQRMILDISRAGTTSTGLVTVNRIDVGADNMLASAGGVGSLPASMFANNGVDLNVSFAPATPGIQIVVQLVISAAPTTTDTVVVAGGMLGTSL